MATACYVIQAAAGIATRSLVGRMHRRSISLVITARGRCCRITITVVVATAALSTMMLPFLLLLNIILLLLTFLVLFFLLHFHHLLLLLLPVAVVIAGAGAKNAGQSLAQIGELLEPLQALGQRSYLPVLLVLEVGIYIRYICPKTIVIPLPFLLFQMLNFLPHLPASKGYKNYGSNS
jgi:hypothetical protein